ncbi:neuronal acetylcholine receptor subunit alpha-7 isoform X2 [Eurytemora carolleeae]|uniref:neuronal acetylcholine receptor subunit alpha-7 isoform X2 n=1 Tax=Eurytemora carolleeae TaxID=1294199 RepID=UPI000C78562F|nr:neuronal acetylcholine receptor subunit alpha-7 isoform X2 [Eurytemora carolleeae]|eukprot:XP_023333966.1 neuronal acetylcholine receptor subunit alpha-7-like isoform X2 [Eurytemora affinis]
MISFYSLSILLLFSLPWGAKSGLNERRLLDDLLENYNKLERPVINETEAVVLSFGLTLQQIIDVDEKNQILTTNIWLNLEWNDANLKWNASEYGNVADVRIPPKYIWKPDLLMYNSADEAFDSTYSTNIVLTNEGACTYIPPGIFKSTCKIDITWFPFDDQECEMKFGSWTYDGGKLNLTLKEEKADLGTYVLNGEWHLLDVPASRHEVFYECCPDPYLDITFFIQIRRRTLYYFFNLIVPCVLIASMAVLGFTLPPDSGEKLSLGVTILLSLTVFLNMVSETMPVTSDNPLLGVTVLLSLTIFLNTVSSIIPITSDSPLIGTYFNCIMFMVASSVVTTIMILNYHHRLSHTHEMPEWVRMLFLQWIPWMLRMSRPGEKITLKSILMQNKMRELDTKENSSKSLLANVLDMDDDFRPGGSTHSTFFPTHNNMVHKNGGFIRVTHNTQPFEDTFPTGIQKELNLILKEIRIITDKIKEHDESSAIENDWKFAAMVLDRLCLITFTMFTLIATIAVLAAAPHVIVT